MSKVLASLKPYYYYLVGEGIKKIEVRKGEPKSKIWDRDVLFYMSKDEKSFAKIPKELQEKYRKHFGKVGLEFVCDYIIDYVPISTAEKGYTGYFITIDKDKDCLTNEERLNYGKGKKLYGWHISNLKIYDKPKEIIEFKKECPKVNAINGSCNFCKYSLFKPHSIQPDCNAYLTRPPQSMCYVEEN